MVLSMSKARILGFLFRIGLWAPLLFAFFLKNQIPAIGWPALLGLGLQALVGPVLVRSVRASHTTRPAWSEWGVFLSLSALAGCYFVGRSLWLPVLWEAATLCCLLMYVGTSFSRRSVESIGALLFASAVSGLLLAAWVLSPNESQAPIFLLLAVLLKTAFFGFHLWLPAAYGGAPAHAAALYSGLMVNLPFLLYVQNLHGHWTPSPALLTVLILLSAFGAFYGGLTALFKRDSQRLLAYSSIECVNTLWCCLFLDLFLTSRGLTGLSALWLPIFVLLMVHYSVSKTFQFLTFGHAQEVAGTTQIDSLKGTLRGLGVSPLLLGMGSFSFLGVPGTPGFLAEGALFLALAGLFNKEVLAGSYLLPAICWLLLGIVLGGMAHYRVFLSTVLGVPEKSPPAVPEKSPLIASPLFELAAWMILAPVLLGVFIYRYSYLFSPVPVLEGWLQILIFVSLLVIILLTLAFGFGWRHRIHERKLWDCGGNYSGADLSVPASVYSDPVYSSLGRYFLRVDGTSFFDASFWRWLHGLFDVGHYWTRQVERGEVSTYLRFALSFAISSVGLLYLVRAIFESGVTS